MIDTLMWLRTNTIDRRRVIAFDGGHTEEFATPRATWCTRTFSPKVTDDRVRM